MDSASERDLEADFIGEVTDRFHSLDALFLGVAPAVLVGLNWLSDATRAALVYDRAAPSLLTAFTTHFVHLEAAHLLGNLAVYALVAPVGYLLLLLSDRRGEFLAVTTTVLLVFPFALSGLATLVVPRGTLVGFSGLGMAYVGVLPVALFLFLDERIEPTIGLDDSPVLFFAGMALIAYRTVPTTVGLSIAAAAGGLTVVYAIRIARTVPRLSRARLRRLLVRSGYLELAVVAPLVFGLAMVAAFPGDPTGAGTVTDLFGHLVGYSLGFLVTYLTVRLDRAIGVGR